MKKIIFIAFLIFALILSGCVEPPVTPPVEPPIEPPVEPLVEPPVTPPVEPPVGSTSWGFGSTNPIHDSSYWRCSDNTHLTNGVTTIECAGECATVDGRDRCIDPKIPPFGIQKTYECVNENWIAISENGETHYYYCQAGCELMADGTTMCWCGTDPDCGKPDNFPGGVGKGNAGAWQCTDSWHFSNGKEKVFCELGCIADICYHPQIPESMPPCDYECISATRMKVTCDGISNEYDCVNGCEDRGTGIDICFIDSDDGGLNPDSKGSGSTVDIMGSEDEEEQNNPFCGDAECNGTETCDTCADDCGTCPPADPFCGDNECNGTETCSTCPSDCGECEPVCGDGECNGLEDYYSCPDDCEFEMGGM